ncbi:MAG: 5'/3'-nucleotidase SurE [Parabacteroides sp.]|nr:5'/3'-nucleotidase SurE [Parabacteroides sp.]
MMNRTPLILITNDDGVEAKGIKELIESLRELGELVVMAPDGPRSGMSGAITSEVPIGYSLVKQERNATIYKCTGTPVDCVKLAINEVVSRKPDLLVSGINHGTNAAICIHYSGTMGAAFEGCIFEVPSLGVSLTSHDPDADFSASCRYARAVARRLLKEGLPKGTYLNLNVPDEAQVKGLKVCRQAEGKWIKEYMKVKSPSGKERFWLTGEFKEYHPEAADTDIYALDHGYASLVPCTIDITDYASLNRLKSWEE